MIARGRNIVTTLMASQETLQLQALEFPALLKELRVPALDGASIHLWHGSPRERRSLLPNLSALLSADEANRRARFHFEADRQNFAFARGMLRTLLAAYLNTDPREVPFRYSEHGKPSLAGCDPEKDLQFNLSHTQGAVLLAICRQRAIGVDVERVREDFSPQEIAARFFSPAEQLALMSLPEADRRQAFFRCWTRKEAFLKARGNGLSFPLERFDVSIGGGETEVRLTTRPDPAEAQCWQILQAPAPEGCVAAVAVASSPQSDRDGGAERMVLAVHERVNQAHDRDQHHAKEQSIHPAVVGAGCGLGRHGLPGLKEYGGCRRRPEEILAQFALSTGSLPARVSLPNATSVTQVMLLKERYLC